jgi:diguanylate cyclase (GGDEF)-like protein
VPHADGSQAQALAGQLLAAIVHATDLHPARGPKITVSVGLALFPDHGADADELLSRADAAMYRAKQAGGHRFQVHEGETARSMDREARSGDGVEQRKP